SDRSAGQPFYSIVDGNDGEVWMRSRLNQKIVCVLKDGVVSELPQNVTPLLRDSKGRMWFVAGDGAIVVKVGEQWVRSKPHLFNMINCMAEGPDGRMWVVHLNGLSQIKLDETAAQPAVSEVGHWSLGSP